MSDIEWTAVLVALISGGGFLTVIVQGWLNKGKGQGSEAQEARALEEVPTPAAPSTSHDTQAINLAQMAMDQVKTLSDKLTVTETRLGEVERELGLFRRSYNALYWWAQRLVYNWEEVREHPDPPALPSDIHHPEV